MFVCLLWDSLTINCVLACTLVSLFACLLVCLLVCLFVRVWNMPAAVWNMSVTVLLLLEYCVVRIRTNNPDHSPGVELVLFCLQTSGKAC